MVEYLLWFSWYKLLVVRHLSGCFWLFAPKFGRYVGSVVGIPCSGGDTQTLPHAKEFGLTISGDAKTLGVSACAWAWGLMPSLRPDHESCARATWWKCHYLIFTALKRSLREGYVFTPVCDSVNRGGMRGCSQGGCAWLLMGGLAWLLTGGHAWLLMGGHAWLLTGGMHGCSWGVCVAAHGGVCGCSQRGHAWLLMGGVRGCSRGGCAWLLMGGMRVFFSRWGTVNEQAVHILLECILVDLFGGLRELSCLSHLQYDIMCRA